MAQLVVIGQIFVAQRQRKDPLPDPRSDRVLDQIRRRLSVKQAANRPTSPIARSVAPSSNAPASEVS